MFEELSLCFGQELGLVCLAVFINGIRFEKKGIRRKQTRNRHISEIKIYNRLNSNSSNTLKATVNISGLNLRYRDVATSESGS
jgi:hypothetical protein